MIENWFNELITTNAIKPDSCQEFFSIKNDPKYAFKANLIWDLFYLAEFFGDSKLKEIVQAKFDSDLHNNFQNLCDFLSSFEERRNGELACQQQFENAKIIAMKHINEFLPTTLNPETNSDHEKAFSKLPFCLIKELISNCFRDSSIQINQIQLFNFISQSLEARHELFDFLDISKLDQSTRTELTHKLTKKYNENHNNIQYYKSTSLLTLLVEENINTKEKFANLETMHFQTQNELNQTKNSYSKLVQQTNQQQKQFADFQKENATTNEKSKKLLTIISELENNASVIANIANIAIEKDNGDILQDILNLKPKILNKYFVY